MFQVINGPHPVDIFTLRPKLEVPTTFSDYKEVNGIMFPHAIGQKMGPMDLNFVVKEIKVNEGVSDANFE